MKAALARKFKDKRLLIILEEIIDSTDKGVPIGNYTSQYFANFFLTPMDHWIKEVLRVKYYFRYCDDIVILGPTKEYLWNIFHKIQDYLKDIQLELKPNWQVFPVESRSVDFLGYKSRHEYILVRKYIKKNFINKLRQSNTFESKRNILGSYWGIFCHANCRNLWRTYTGMRTFKDLGIEVKTRVRVPDIVDKIIIINSMKVKFKRGNKCVDISATYEDREIKFTTFAEMIIEAAEQISNSDLPFETKIISENGFTNLNNMRILKASSTLKPQLLEYIGSGSWRVRWNISKEQKEEAELYEYVEAELGYKAAIEELKTIVVNWARDNFQPNSFYIDGHKYWVSDTERATIKSQCESDAENSTISLTCDDSIITLKAQSVLQVMMMIDNYSSKYKK